MKNQDQKKRKKQQRMYYFFNENAAYDWIYSRVFVEAQYHADSRLAMAIVGDLHEHLLCWLAGKKKGKGHYSLIYP